MSYEQTQDDRDRLAQEHREIKREEKLQKQRDDYEQSQKNVAGAKRLREQESAAEADPEAQKFKVITANTTPMDIDKTDNTAFWHGGEKKQKLPALTEKGVARAPWKDKDKYDRVQADLAAARGRRTAAYNSTRGQHINSARSLADVEANYKGYFGGLSEAQRTGFGRGVENDAKLKKMTKWYNSTKTGKRPYTISKMGKIRGGTVYVMQRVQADFGKGPVEAGAVAMYPVDEPMDDKYGRKLTRAIASYDNPALHPRRRDILYRMGGWKQ